MSGVQACTAGGEGGQAPRTALAYGVLLPINPGDLPNEGDAGWTCKVVITEGEFAGREVLHYLPNPEDMQNSEGARQMDRGQLVRMLEAVGVFDPANVASYRSMDFPGAVEVIIDRQHQRGRIAVELELSDASAEGLAGLSVSEFLTPNPKIETAWKLTALKHDAAAARRREREERPTFLPPGGDARENERRALLFRINDMVGAAFAMAAKGREEATEREERQRQDAERAAAAQRAKDEAAATRRTAMAARDAAAIAVAKELEAAGVVVGVLYPDAAAVAALAKLERDASDGEAGAKDRARATAEAAEKRKHMADAADVLVRVLDGMGFATARSGDVLAYGGKLLAADDGQGRTLGQMVRAAAAAHGMTASPLWRGGDDCPAHGADALVGVLRGAAPGEDECLFRSEADAEGWARPVMVSFPKGMCLAGEAEVSALAEHLPALRPAADVLRVAERFGYGGESTAWPAVADVLARAARAADPKQEDRTRLLLGGQFFPMGRASLFIGSGGEGKGTWLLQLLAAVSSGAAEVFGLPVHPDFQGGNVVLLAGEDDQGELEDRMDRMRSGGVDAGEVVCISRENGKTLTDALAEARQVPNLAAVVVDPAGRWMQGEFGGDAEEAAVNAVYMLVDAFARETGAAVIVVHHLPKASAVQRGGPVVARETPRGTEAWRDAFRQVVTFRKNPKDEPPGARLHLEKSNIASAPPGAILRFNYDPATLLHRVVAEAPAAATKAPISKPAAGNAGDVEDVAAAVARLVSGETPSKVSRTGKASLFERNQRPRDRVPEVDGWPRARVEAAVSAAIASSVLSVDPKLGLRPS